jgi:transcriptional antiterminator NusG
MIDHPEPLPTAEGSAPASEPVPLPSSDPLQAPAAGAGPAAASEAAAPARAAGARWFAVRVQSNKEDSVKRNMDRRIELRGLGHKILQVVVPTEKVAEIKGGKRRTRQVKTYPGYVLVEMLMDDETWAFVRETAGVGDFVGGGGTIHQKPFPLLPEEVNKIFGVEVPGQETPRIKIAFAVGDRVKIREGPFENFEGLVEEINEQKGTVRVTVTIFGRATPVELKYWEVEPVI